MKPLRRNPTRLNRFPWRRFTPVKTKKKARTKVFFFPADMPS